MTVLYCASVDYLEAAQRVVAMVTSVVGCALALLGYLAARNPESLLKKEKKAAPLKPGPV